MAAFTGFDPKLICKGGSLPLKLLEINFCFILTNNYISCQERDILVSQPGKLCTIVGHLIFFPFKEVVHFIGNTLFSPSSATAGQYISDMFSPSLLESIHRIVLNWRCYLASIKNRLRKGWCSV